MTAEFRSHFLLYLVSFADEGNGMGFNALSAPGEAHALVRFCLNAHAANINPERA